MASASFLASVSSPYVVKLVAHSWDSASLLGSTRVVCSTTWRKLVPVAGRTRHLASASRGVSVTHLGGAHQSTKLPPTVSVARFIGLKMTRTGMGKWPKLLRRI